MDLGLFKIGGYLDLGLFKIRGYVDLGLFKIKGAMCTLISIVVPSWIDPQNGKIQGNSIMADVSTGQQIISLKKWSCCIPLKAEFHYGFLLRLHSKMNW